MAALIGGKCDFVRAWIGYCNEDVHEGHRCLKHSKEVCCSCGAPATRECDETMWLVCGAPICNDCEHTIQDNGCSGMGNLPPGLKSHCKKGEQVYKSWYARDNKEDIYLNPCKNVPIVEKGAGDDYPIIPQGK